MNNKTKTELLELLDKTFTELETSLFRGFIEKTSVYFERKDSKQLKRILHSYSNQLVNDLYTQLEYNSYFD